MELGRDDNAWDEVIRDMHDTLTAEAREIFSGVTFTTTSPIDLVCQNVALMDITQAFFRDRRRIPWVDLTGTVGDWALIQNKAVTLRDFCLEWWTTELLPVLDEFVAA